MTDWSVEELMLRGESKELDFKGPMRWDPKGNTRACCKLVKHIMAMANTNGGRLVIGVREEPTGTVAVGLDANDAKTWDSTKVNQFIAEYASSPINTTLVKRDHQEATLVVIDVPVFPRMPVICSGEFSGVLRRGAIYVRTDNNESAEITAVDQQNQLIERALRNRADELLREVRSVIVGGQASDVGTNADQFTAQLAEAQSWFDGLYGSKVPERTGYLQVSAWPSQFLEERFTRDDLFTVAERANHWYGGYSGLFIHSYPEGPHAIQEGIEDSFDWAGEPGRFYGWRIYRSGLWFHRQVIPEDVRLEANQLWGAHDVGELIGIERLGAFVAIAVDSSNTIFRSLGVSGEEVTIRVEVLGTEGRQLKAPPQWTLIDSGLVSQVENAMTQLSLPVEEWIAGDTDHAYSLANELMSLFNLRTGYRRDKIAEVLHTRRDS